VVNFLSRCLLAIFLYFLVASSASASVDEEAQLSWSQRPIAVFRVVYNGATPAARVARARARLAEFESRNLPLEIEQVNISVKEAGREHTGIALRAQDIVLLTLLKDDLDPADHLNLTQAAGAAATRLRDALAAAREQREPAVLARGALRAAVATAVALLLAWLLMRANAALRARLAEPGGQEGSAQEHRLAIHARSLLTRLAQIAATALGLAITYAWLAYVLHEFPATLPLSQRLGEYVWHALGEIGSGVIGAVPGLIAVALIAVLAEALSRAAQGAFRAVQAGRLALPGVHRETAGATRRMVVGAIWILAIVAAYPYIPGSGSGVFQGFSVLIGAMVTLGSSGIANQIMSGLTLVYSRALRRGDHVFIGAPGTEIEGVVTEVGTLATKIVTMRNEEITVPNAVVVANPIRNFSKLAEGEGTLVSTRVTIGYDAPWRQVHAMLEEAARRTPGLRAAPAPRVAQRGLADFYVEYELFANIDRPLDKVHTLSRLHAAIQDVFNEYGVQIMSPHFLGQPADPVLVRKENRHAAPAPPPPAPPT
jgi:small-conductance mechanosensitive channel